MTSSYSKKPTGPHQLKSRCKDRPVFPPPMFQQKPASIPNQNGAASQSSLTTKPDGVMVLLSPHIDARQARWREQKVGRLLKVRFVLGVPLLCFCVVHSQDTSRIVETGLRSWQHDLRRLRKSPRGRLWLRQESSTPVLGHARAWSALGSARRRRDLIVKHFRTWLKALWHCPSQPTGAEGDLIGGLVFALYLSQAFDIVKSTSASLWGRPPS